jgi:transcriptional regulator of met regulon
VRAPAWLTAVIETFRDPLGLKAFNHQLLLQFLEIEAEERARRQVNERRAQFFRDRMIS